MCERNGKMLRIYLCIRMYACVRCVYVWHDCVYVIPTQATEKHVIHIMDGIETNRQSHFHQAHHKRT